MHPISTTLQFIFASIIHQAASQEIDETDLIKIRGELAAIGLDSVGTAVEHEVRRMWATKI